MFVWGRNHGIHGNALRATRMEVAERQQPSDFPPMKFHPSFMEPRGENGFRRNAQSSSTAYRAAEGVSCLPWLISSTEIFNEPLI